VTNGLCLAGVGMVAGGLWLLHPAAALVVVGGVLTWVGIYLYRRK
jgi:hypothetical protein